MIEQSDSTADAAESVWGRGLPPLLCVLAVPVIFFLVNPMLEIGINDDWVYARMARLWAETGHLQFDGATAADVGAHAFWGMILIRLFGFSFSLLRVSMIPVTCGCALSIYAIARWLGTRRNLSALASVIVISSPLFVPVWTNFMTDVTALLFFLLALLLALRACSAEENVALVYLAACVVAGLLSGTVRQVFWGAPPLMLAGFLLLRRTSRKLLIGGTALFVSNLAATAGLLHWFHTQKNFNMERIPRPGSLADIRVAAYASVDFLLTLALLSSPAILYLLSDRRIWRRPLIRILAATAITTAFFWRYPSFRRFPWMGNTLTVNGPFGTGSTLVGNLPVILTPRACSVIGFAATALLFFGILSARRAGADLQPAGVPPGTAEALNRQRWRMFCWLAIPYSIAYLLLLAIRGLLDPVFDRYLLPILPVCILSLFAMSRKFPMRFASVAAGISALAFAAYAVATTHDAFRISEAQMLAADRLTTSGIPRACISAGYAYDGWTEAEIAGYIPVFSVMPLRNTKVEPFFLRYTPHVMPKYFVVASPQATLPAEPYLTVDYSTWLPPRKRMLLVQQDPDASCQPKL